MALYHVYVDGVHRGIYEVSSGSPMGLRTKRDLEAYCRRHYVSGFKILTQRQHNAKNV